MNCQNKTDKHPICFDFNYLMKLFFINNLTDFPITETSDLIYT
jgi:hypothetical protein